ncbi:uncharacterized protein TNCV_971841 [Trichonephila clavipes]|nr:uncharacterized protein TNCV_971841 [Trichonephila clavipes]
MTAQRYVHDILQPHATSTRSRFFNKAMLSLARQECHKTVSALLLPFLSCPIPRFVSNRAYLRSFGTASWASHEFERTRGKVTANRERNVSRQHTKLVCLNADRIASCIRARGSSTGTRCGLDRSHILENSCSSQVLRQGCPPCGMHATLWQGGVAMGSLVVGALESGPEGLGSMPVPPNTLRVHTEYVLVKSVGPKVLWAESRVQGTGENFPPLQFHA